MVADTITKEEAAKFIKKSQQEAGSSAARNLTANMLWVLFNSIDDVDISDVELAPGEADEMFEQPFVMEEDFS
jgi:hypothetical protein